MSVLFESSGILRYSYTEEYGYKLVLEVDKGIADFYRSLIPKWIKVNSQMYAPHISVVRKEVPANLDVWGKYEGEIINFLYENQVNNGIIYYWLNAFCIRLEKIRIELGLPVSSQYTLPPEGFTKCFHITIANEKKIVDNQK